MAQDLTGGSPQSGNQRPLEVVKKMLSDTYDDLDKKDMTKEQFISECTSVMVGKVKKKSSILLPGKDF